MPAPSSRVDRVARVSAAASIVLSALTIAGAVSAAAERSGWGTVAALAAGVAVELGTSRRSPLAVGALRQANAGRPVRGALQLLAVVLLAARCLPSSVVIGTTIAAVVATALAVGADAARLLIMRIRRLPLVTRNIDLGEFALPAPPPPMVMDPRGADAVVPLVAAVGLTIAIRHGASTTAAAVGLALATTLAAVPAAILAVQLVVLLRARLRTRLTKAASEAIDELAPEVVLYFAATVAELYQLRMWLEPVEQLGRPAAVVLRSHDVFDALGETSLPVICSPYNGTIASLPLPPRVAALFVTHSGNNLSMLRRPEVRSVFVGHGDSDKPDSVNPFARVYDQVWVAGPLGRRRYEREGIAIADAAIVEVGRPQLTAGGRPPSTATILYAPTWEGWGDDPHHSSLALAGPALVERLAARTDIHVRYRPHPLTGRRDPALRAAHERILALVGRVPEDEPIDESFAQASGLIGDVSSVINDYLPWDRPYAVIDTRELGERVMVERFPSTAGGFVMSPELDLLDEFVNAALGGPDLTRTRRRELLTDVLGDPATAPARFAAAISRLLGDTNGR